MQIIGKTCKTSLAGFLFESAFYKINRTIGKVLYEVLKKFIAFLFIQSSFEIQIQTFSKAHIKKNPAVAGFV